MLELKRLTVQFGGLTALDDVTLTVGDREVMGLVGPNGAGKTTLFNAISGLVKPSTGKVRFKWNSINRHPIFARARLGIGRTFQAPQPLQHLTVGENLLVAQRFGARKLDPKRMRQILEFTGLAGKVDIDAATGLSLTELKALEIAKALAIAPKLLLLDEVLAGLETQGKRRFMGMLGEMQARFNLSIIVIEHDIEVISTLCPRVAVLNFGRLIADGSPDTVFRDPAVIASYTGNSNDAAAKHAAGTAPHA